jgi:hypothetical protein
MWTLSNYQWVKNYGNFQKVKITAPYCGSQILKVRNRSSATFFSPQLRNRFGRLQNCGGADLNCECPPLIVWRPEKTHRLNLERLNLEWDFCPNGLNPEWDQTPNGTEPRMDLTPNGTQPRMDSTSNGLNLEWTLHRIGLNTKWDST